jgi:hypothetical protein
MTRALAAPALAAVLAFAPLSAKADDVVSKAPDKTAITIYRDKPVSTWALTHREPGTQAGGLAFIVETRTIDLPQGASTIRFEGVSDEIAPQTAEVDGLPARTVERNFDYDLLTPGSLIAKSLGQEVELVDTNQKTGKAQVRRAVLRSGPNGVMLDVDGKAEAFKCDSVPQRMVFSRIPEGLSDRPTLSLKVDAPKAGRYVVRLSYLATNFNWASDYVARLRPDGKTLDLEGWITLANGSNESFSDAPTQVVAGRVALTGDDQAVEIAPIVRREACWNRNPALWSAKKEVKEVIVTGRRVLLRSSAGMVADSISAEDIGSFAPAPMAKAEDFGDYKLYTLPDPTTVAARQTKQVLFLSRKAVPFEQVYRVTVFPPPAGEPVPGRSEILLRLQNTEAGGLGLALPKGVVSMREPDPAGDPLFTGEAALDDTPKGLPVKLYLGPSPSVLATVRVVSRQRFKLAGRSRDRDSYEVSIVNASARPAVVEVVHPPQGVGFAVVGSDRPHDVDAGWPRWTVTVAPGATEVVSYTVQVDDSRPVRVSARRG